MKDSQEQLYALVKILKRLGISGETVSGAAADTVFFTPEGAEYIRPVYDSHLMHNNEIRLHIRKKI
jgi:hypothetical protein